MNGRWYRQAGTMARAPWLLELTQGDAGWTWASLRVAELPAGGSLDFSTGGEEMLVIPLSGGCTIKSQVGSAELAGRASPFASTTDFVYVPAGVEVTLRSEGGGRFAVAGALAGSGRPFHYVGGDEVQVELRGAGQCSRQVNNYCMPQTMDAERLMVCEVVTPAGNWSSYPPHKHDVDSNDESATEEIYYFEVHSPAAVGGMGYQRVYASDDRDIDLLAEVRSGDVVLVPHGWHGPSMAAPGYDLYYLNVMAGGGARRWLACFDPAHDWVRNTWPDLEIDQRLPFPMGSYKSRTGGI